MADTKEHPRDRQRICGGVSSDLHHLSCGHIVSPMINNTATKCACGSNCREHIFDSAIDIHEFVCLRCIYKKHFKNAHKSYAMREKVLVEARPECANMSRTMRIKIINEDPVVHANLQAIWKQVRAEAKTMMAGGRNVIGASASIRDSAEVEGELATAFNTTLSSALPSQEEDARELDDDVAVALTMFK